MLAEAFTYFSEAVQRDVLGLEERLRADGFLVIGPRNAPVRRGPVAIGSHTAAYLPKNVTRTQCTRRANSWPPDMTEVTVRAYGPLNDFVPPHRRQVSWRHSVDGHPSVKDVVESLGIPHPEIDLVLVNGASVAFDHIIRSGERIAVFSRFMTLDITTLTHVRPPPLDEARHRCGARRG